MKSIYLLLVCLLLSFSSLSRDRMERDSTKKQITHGINIEAFGSSYFYSVGYSLLLVQDKYSFSFSSNFSYLPQNYSSSSISSTSPFSILKFDNYFGKKIIKYYLGAAITQIINWDLLGTTIPASSCSIGSDCAFKYSLGFSINTGVSFFVFKDHLIIDLYANSFVSFAFNYKVRGTHFAPIFGGICLKYYIK